MNARGTTSAEGGAGPRRLRRLLLIVPILLLLPPGRVEAQALRGVVEAAGDGVVRFSFPARPGVRICDDGIRTSAGGERRWRGRNGWRPASRCAPGPVRVEVSAATGRVISVELLRPSEAGREGAREVGEVVAGRAVAFLTGVVRGDGASEAAAEEAVLPLVLADVERVWETLLELARDRSVAPDARSSALFWLGQEAAEAVTAGLAEVAAAELEAQEIRDAAVFALSQRPADEGVPALMELARTAPHPETRRSALFWLAQDPSPAVVDFFAEILRRGGDAGVGGR